MCFTLKPSSGRSFSDYYPGPSVIDVLAFDCYNQSASSGAYMDPATMFASVLAVSRSTGKPFAITEFGSLLVKGDSTGVGRAAWLRASATYLAAQGALFVTYFDSPVTAEYRLMDPASIAAWRAVIGSV
jgi:hypothetical protein